MTDDREAWDDARLKAAFAAFADAAPTPRDLVPSTIVAMQSGVARPRWRWTPWLRLAGVVVAAIAVVALVSWPRPGPMPVGQAVAVADLPIIEVPELIDRMADPKPGEVVVHGWFAVAPVTLDCEVVEDPHPLIPDCEEWYRFLMADPETLGGVRGDPGPVGRHVVPMLRVDSHIGIVSESGETVEVLAVGHLADHRTGTCPDGDEPECARRFVIDRLLPADATIDPMPDPWAAAGPPIDTRETVADALLDVIGPLSVASIGTIAPADLASIEPVAAGDEPVVPGLVWVIRALVDGSTEPRTFIVVDGTAAAGPRVSEITADGVLDVAGPDPAEGSTENPGPSRSPVPSTPPEGEASVRPIGDVRGGWEATFPVEDGSRRRVVVIDRTGTLRDVRLPTVQEGATVIPAIDAVQAIELDGITTLVAWSGSACEMDVGVEVTSTDGYELTLSGRRDAACRMAQVRTTLVFEWDAPPGPLAEIDERAWDDFPSSVAGLDVLAVSDAVGIRAADDEREIAVKGTFRIDPRRDCGAPDIGPLLDPGCRSPARAATLFGPEGGDGIRFVTADPSALVAADDGTPVVLVGHFDDPRADQCADVAACEDVLFVDAIWIDGRLTSGHWSWATDGSRPPYTPDVINRLLPDRTPTERDVSVGTLAGTQLALLEPMTAGSAAASDGWVWHVTRLDGDRVQTYVVTESQALRSIEAGERTFYQEMADGQFVELTVTEIID